MTNITESKREGHNEDLYCSPDNDGNYIKDEKAKAFSTHG
jgi:hypothetical protein